MCKEMISFCFVYTCRTSFDYMLVLLLLKYKPSEAAIKEAIRYISRCKKSEKIKKTSI